jgi:hypothetical protein
MRESVGETGGAASVFRGGGVVRRGLTGGCARRQARGALSSPASGRPAPPPTLVRAGEQKERNLFPAAAARVLSLVFL